MYSMVLMEAGASAYCAEFIIKNSNYLPLRVIFNHGGMEVTEF
jgi:hypothetical protein